MRASLQGTVMLISAALCGCSLGYVDNASGGDQNLPTLGAGPFQKPLIDFDTPAEEPYVAVIPRAIATEPAVLDRDDGGFRLWYSRQEDEDGESQIWASEIPSVFELADVAPGPVLLADQEWEQGSVGAPSIIRLQDGRMLMLYQGGVAAPAVGAAYSDDDGATWVKETRNPVLEDAVTPSVARSAGELVVVFSRPDDATAIYAADGSSATELVVRDAPILEARIGNEDAFDAAGISSPNIVIQRTVAGRLHLGLHYTGTNTNGVSAIGFAGSFDGQSWQLFQDGLPVVDGDIPSEAGPAWVVRDTAAFLFFSQPKQLRGAIAVAIH